MKGKDVERLVQEILNLQRRGLKVISYDSKEGTIVYSTEFGCVEKPFKEKE